jgi:hypothetical protein
MAADNMRWSVNMGKNDLEIIDHRKAISKYGLVNINNQITDLNRIVYDERQMYVRLKVNKKFKLNRSAEV